MSAIIHIDLDYFYAQVEEVSQKSLVNKPVGIRQKGILATCNYVARSYGINKLSRVTDALEKCPSLILIDGSDLTRYRRVSSQIYTLVRWIFSSSLVSIQRVGMDELVLDVTQLIYLTDSTSLVWPDGSRQFTFPSRSNAFPTRQSVLIPPGFSYTDTPIGKPVGSCQNSLLASDHVNKLILASHMASHVRKAIFDELGYTCSTGVSHSKLYAKLAANVVKPNGQTIWFDSIEADQTFVDYPMSALPGFGHAMQKTLAAHLRDSQIQDDYALQFQENQENDEISVSEKNITIKEARELDPSVWETLYKDKGSDIFQWIHGYDDSKVDDFKAPTQYSVEDTFAPCTELTKATSILLALTQKLMSRIQEEEIVDGKWNRLPSTFRLSSYMGSKQVSRSCPLPPLFTDAFLNQKLELIASDLVKSTVMPLLLKMIDSCELNASGFNVALINFKDDSSKGEPNLKRTKLNQKTLTSFWK